MATRPAVPLTTLLSQVLIGYTIEFDNEFERRLAAELPLRYVVRRFQLDPANRERRVLTVSMAQWFNLMRVVSDEPRTVAAIERDTGAPLHTQGMERWGYIHVDPGDDTRKLVRGIFGDLQDGPRPGWTVQATSVGALARSLWLELPAEIDARWNERFGATAAQLQARWRGERRAPGRPEGHRRR